MTKAEQMRASGKYPIANLKIFDSIKMLKFSEFTLDHEKDTESIFDTYIESILEMNEEEIDKYLEAIKASEIIDNQSLEKEDSFLMSIYLTAVKENSIDYLLENIDKFDKEHFIEAHKILLKGTKSQKFEEKDYRDDDEAFVARFEGNNPIIRYFSLPCINIEEAINNIIEFSNSEELEEHSFLKPQIIHGVVAALQMFDDGNTRYARLLQNVKFHQLMEEKENYSFTKPIIYGTRSYFPHRSEYRKLIADLAINPSDESWNKWFNFNLNRKEDQIFFLENKVEQYKRLIK